MSEKDVLKKQEEETAEKEKETKPKGMYVIPPEDEDYWLRCEEGNKVGSIFDK
ncbi:MAG: hypothetical protein MJ171_03325 [Clostridia bacterium]|nr:hypothetical protein [Clostridia bacterium]